MGVSATLVELSGARLDELLSSPQLYAEIAWQNDRSDLEIDAYWATLDWLLLQLTRLKRIPYCDPLPSIVWDEQSIEADDVMVQYRRPQEVQSIANTLRTISRDDLFAVFEPDQMTQESVYPNVSEGWTWEDFDSVFSNFDALVRFYDQAATKGAAVIMWIV